MKITDGKQTRAVYINWIQHHVQPQLYTEEVPPETSQATK